jgi:hypothetical protein
MAGTESSMDQTTLYQRFDAISLGLAVGLTSAVFVFLLGLSASMLGWGVGLAQALSSIFIGFSPTLVGSIAGAVWAFVDGLVAGLLIGWFYNRFLLVRLRINNRGLARGSEGAVGPRA